VESGAAYAVLAGMVVLKEPHRAVKSRSRPDRRQSQTVVLWTSLLSG
jgi:hypothetical protein